MSWWSWAARALEFARANRAIFGNPAIVASVTETRGALRDRGQHHGTTGRRLDPWHPRSRVRFAADDPAHGHHRRVPQQHRRDPNPNRATAEHPPRTRGGLPARFAARQAPRAGQRRFPNNPSCSSSARQSGTRRRTWIRSRVSRRSCACRRRPCSASSRSTSVGASSAATCGGSKTMPAGWRRWRSGSSPERRQRTFHRASRPTPGCWTGSSCSGGTFRERLVPAGSVILFRPAVVFRRAQGICRRPAC